MRNAKSPRELVDDLCARLCRRHGPSVCPYGDTGGGPEGLCPGGDYACVTRDPMDGAELQAARDAREQRLAGKAAPKPAGKAAPKRAGKAAPKRAGKAAPKPAAKR